MATTPCGNSRVPSVWRRLVPTKDDAGSRSGAWHCSVRIGVYAYEGTSGCPCRGRCQPDPQR
jgi:hypothetical protein